jgi:hypothetical protein
MNLQPDETVLEGKWIVVNGAVDGDETCKRIDQLVRDHLQLVGTADDGWSKLFLDKNDGRYWEHTYSHSEWHGGGPPTLTWVSDEYAKSKYDV